jgi:hypothetical protein
MLVLRSFWVPVSSGISPVLIEVLPGFSQSLQANTRMVSGLGDYQILPDPPFIIRRYTARILAESSSDPQRDR